MIKWLGAVLPRVGLRVFLLAWIVDILTPAGHIDYWTAVLAVIGFHIVVTIIGDGLFTRVFQFQQAERLTTNMRSLLTRLNKEV
jgi:hypothetical protein